MRRQHLAREGDEVALVQREIVDMALAAGRASCRSEPPWPRQSIVATARSRREQVADGLVIFLDELRASAEQRRRCRAGCSGVPSRRAQPHAVDGDELVLDGAGRDRIVRAFRRAASPGDLSLSGASCRNPQLMPKGKTDRKSRGRRETGAPTAAEFAWRIGRASRSTARDLQSTGSRRRRRLSLGGQGLNCTVRSLAFPFYPLPRLDRLR